MLFSRLNTAAECQNELLNIEETMVLLVNHWFGRPFTFHHNDPTGPAAFLIAFDCICDYPYTPEEDFIHAIKMNRTNSSNKPGSGPSGLM